MTELFLSNPLAAQTHEIPIKIECDLTPHEYNSADRPRITQENLVTTAPKRAIFTIIRKKRSLKLKNNDSQFSQLSENLSQTPVKKYNRKEKSLGELSRKLLMKYGRLDNCMLYLDQVTLDLGVERRRIYDVINILESLKVIYRKGKNSYQWKGLEPIRYTLEELNTKQEEIVVETSREGGLVIEEDKDSNSKSKKEKSLGLLSTGFLKLFLGWNSTFSLEQAAQRLSIRSKEGNQMKTKVRRLYDIANVFASLGLIKKTLTDNRKPAFTWIGISGLDQFIRRLNSSEDEKEIFVSKPSKKSLLKSIANQKEPLRKTPTASIIKSVDSAFKSPTTAMSSSQNKLTDNSTLFKCFLEFLQEKITNYTSKGDPKEKNAPIDLNTEEGLAQMCLNAVKYTSENASFEDVTPLKESTNQKLIKAQSYESQNSITTVNRKVQYMLNESDFNVKKKLFKARSFAVSQNQNSQGSQKTKMESHILPFSGHTQ